MNMLRAMDLLKKDLIQQNTCNNKLDVLDSILGTYTDGNGIPKGRMIHFYGHPDCGKTSIARYIINKNKHLSFVYISSKQDSISKMNFLNAVVFRSSIFEDTIDFISRINKNDADVIIIDDIHSMLSKEELASAFTKKLNTYELFNKYIKALSLLAAKKNICIIVFNSINLINDKSRYGYLLDKECVASIRVNKIVTTNRAVEVELIPDRNLMAQVKNSENFILYNNL